MSTAVQNNLSSKRSSRDLIKVETYPNPLEEDQKENINPPYELKVNPHKHNGNLIKQRPFSSSSNESIPIDSYYNEEYFKGKILIPWLFFINETGVYNKVVNCLDNLTPYARSSEELKKYFTAENALFKVVVDIGSVQEILGDISITEKIKEVYLYNNSTQNDKRKTQEIIEEVKKKFGLRLKSVFVSIDTFLKEIQDENEKHETLINQTEVNLMSNQTNELSYPSLINLSQEHPSYTNLIRFRENLWTALKMSTQHFSGDNSLLPSQYFIDSFKLFTERFYFNDQKSLQEIENFFNKVSPSNFSPDKEDEMCQILLFNQRGSFFERFITNMLRIYEKVSEEKSVIFLFAKHYSAIKYFYEKCINSKERNEQEEFIEVYCLVKVKDVEKLEEGEIVQNLGFIYCSKDKQEIESKVRRNDTSMMKIRLPIMVNAIKSDENKVFDHGFVDYYSMCEELSKQWNEVSEEQEIKNDILHQVVINAFNLFKVTKSISENHLQTIEVEYTTLGELEANLEFHEENNLSPSTTSTIKTNLKALKQQTTQKYDIADFYHFINDKEKEIQERKLLLTKNKNSETNLIKIIEIIEDTENNTSLESQKQKQKILKEISLNLLKYDNKEFKDKSELRSLIKCVLVKNEDTINVQKILNKEINVLKEGLRKVQNNPSERENILTEYVETLNQSGGNLMEMGKYTEAQKKFKETIELIEDELNLENKNKNQNLPSMCCSWFKNIFSRNEENNKVENMSNEESVRKLNETKFRKFFKYIINAIISLLKTYRITDHEKEEEKKYYIEKGQKYIELMNNTKEETMLMEKEIIDIKTLEIKFIIESSGDGLIMDKIENNKIDNKLTSYDSILQNINTKIANKDHKDLKSLEYIEFRDTLFEWKKRQMKNLLTYSSCKKYEFIESSEERNEVEMVSQSHIMEKETVTEENSKIESQYQELLSEMVEHYKASINIKVSQFSENSPEVFKTKNDLTELLIENKNSSEAKEILNTLLKCSLAQEHSEGSKSEYLVAKISFQLGHYKQSFERLNSAFNILKRVTLKENEKEYQEILKKSPMFRKIELLRASIYNEQERYDLSLRSLEFLEAIPCDTEDYIKILEMKAETIALRKGSGDEKNFINEYEKVIEILSKNSETVNIKIGIIYCSIAKCLVRYENFEEAKKYLKKAKEIFDKFPTNNPNIWVYYFTKSMLLIKEAESLSEIKSFEYITNIKDSIEFAEKALENYNKKYGERSISYLKLRMHYAKLVKSLHGCNNIDGCEQESENVIKIYEEIRTSLIEIDREDNIKETDFQLKVDSEVQSLLKIIEIELTPPIIELIDRSVELLQKEDVENGHEELRSMNMISETSNNENGSDETEGLSEQTGKKLINNNNEGENSEMISESNKSDSNCHIVSKKLFVQSIELEKELEEQVKEV